MTSPQTGTDEIATGASSATVTLDDPGLPTKSGRSGRWLTVAEGAVLPVLLVGVFIAFAVAPGTGDVFLTSANLRGILVNQAVIILAAVAVVPSISAGLYDLSVGATIGAAAMAAQGAARDGRSLLVIVGVALLAGLVIGIVNGVLIAYLKINSLIATLGTSTVIAALVSWYSAGATINAPLPPRLVQAVNGELFGLPRAAIIACLVAAAVYFVMEHTPLGRSFHAMGSNPSAAKLVGLNVRVLTVAAMAITGAIAGMGAIVITVQNGGASPQNGPGFTLVALSAVFLGSTAIRPGRFNVAGAVIAVLFVAIIVNGLTLAGADPWVSPMINGLALLAAVALSIAVRGKAVGS
jgi:ribose transport system permease protein